MPPQPDPDLQTGLQFLRAGWFDRAEPLFRGALARHGERPDILHYLAVCLSQRGAVQEAEGLWRKAVAKDPNEPIFPKGFYNDEILNVALDYVQAFPALAAATRRQ